MSEKPREMSKNAIEIMRKIRILSKTIDLHISHLETSAHCQEFFSKVRDKELLVSLRRGSYCTDETLQMMFRKYEIR